MEPHTQPPDGRGERAASGDHDDLRPAARRGAASFDSDLGHAHPCASSRQADAVGGGAAKPAPPSDPFGALVVRIAQARDEAAFRELFDAFAPRIKAVLLRQGTQPARAEELAQETLLAVWRKASYFDPARATAAAWIFTLARNLRIDAFRHDRLGDGLETDPFSQEEQPSAPDAVLLASEREDAVLHAVHALPEDQRQVIQSSFFHDKPHSEIARDLALPLGTVKSRIRTALIRLKGKLGDAR